ncbi:hypothetical protein [Aeromicrobium sp. Leaf350]|uniref:hypothetical protein n=1 Tax=Aeromicrobium sp. Leaf350 TaxID=2876565 RepID=UPI001E65B158|nr:hypothetical protein [Aeromicrobium sp. Leaf350]
MRATKRTLLAGMIAVALLGTGSMPSASAVVDPNPGVVDPGLEERLLALPQGSSIESVVAAMYPDNDLAQADLLEVIDLPESGQSRSSTPDHMSVAPRSGIGKAWKIAKCVAAVGVFIAGNALLITKASKFGGVAKGAKLIVEAGNRQERLKLLIAIFGEVSGLSAVASKCG